MRLKSALSVLFTTVALAIAAQAQTLPQGVQKRASLGGITEYAFPNGLHVLLFPDSSNPKVTINMTYLVGSRHEGYGETGMAHLLEHMNFIETTNARQIKKEIVDHGAQWNGTTSYDRTNYFETVTASDENLKWALGLEADRMVNVKMEKALLDTEMTVVRNEFERGENSPQRVLEERVVSTAYLWHNYGKSTIGSREDIEKVPIDRLAAFYRKFYQPDNAVLVIAGQFDPAKALGMVAETCGKIPHPARVLDETYTVEPVQDGERYVELRRIGNGRELMMAYHAPAAGHPDSAPLQVLAGIMGGGFGGGSTGRLSKALVEAKKALSANMSFRQLHDPGFILVSVGLADDQSLEEARQITIQMLESAAKVPPGNEEVERVKTRLLRGIEQRLADAQQLGLGLTTPISQGDWRLMFLEYDQVKNVSPEDVQRVAKLYLKASNRTIGEFIPVSAPDRAVVTARTNLETVFKDYKSGLTVARGEDFEPTPANIESRIVRSHLANGMKVAMLPRKTAGGRVSAIIELHFGDAKSLAGKSAIAQLTGNMLSRGTKNKTRQQLQEEMDKLDARIAVTGGGGIAGGGGGGRGGRGGFGGAASSVSSATATIDTKAENLVPAMRLAVEMLREPAFAPSDFEQMQQRRLQALQPPPTDPGVRATEELQRHLSPYSKDDPRYLAPREDQIAELKNVSLDDVKKFHDKFYGASHGELVIAGQFDQEAIQKAVPELLGNWNSAAIYEHLRSAYKKTDSINLKIETPDKENAQFEAGIRIQMADGDPDYPAMLLANYMFGGSIAARMPNRIRNVEGLSYGASSRFAAPSEGDAAMFSATISSNPLNTPKVETSFKDELAKALKNGFTADEVAAAKKAFLDQQIVARSQEAALLRLLASHEQLGRTMKWDEQLEAKIRALTPEQINAAFRRHLDPDALSIVKAGDFQKAGVFQEKLTSEGSGATTQNHPR
ncbi:MAG TPA: pitrilysin family protein [Candidatus Angelobacter sp.]|jgi:zinc protease|nr:pitrilysin family protein [Candidatus Angelobacter sp.]